MSSLCVVAILLLCLGSFHLCLASLGDTDPHFRKYVEQCAASGCLNGVCISGCMPTPEETVLPEADSDLPDADSGLARSDPVLPQRNASAIWVTAPPELVLTQWDCLSECKFQSMELREQERGPPPMKYYGKWPFTRLYGLQEPGSVFFSVLNFLATFIGLASFVLLVYFKLPRKPMGDKGPVYEYTALVIIYGLAHCNSWFWSAVFHGRDTKFTEHWDYSSAIAVMGMGLLLAIIRTAELRQEAARVMVAAPVIAFFTTHICYLNFYEMDYGWNIMVCTVVGVVQLLLWMIWTLRVRHPCTILVWATCLGTALAMLLELYDFPPFWGLLDAHALWHAATVPITFMWWAFLKEDAKYNTKVILSKGGKSVKKTD